MDNIQCTGNELEISQCRFEGWGKNDCEASEAAGVVCAGGEMELNRTKLLKKLPKHRIHKKYDLEIRLSGGRNKCEGQVEVGRYDCSESLSYILIIVLVAFETIFSKHI